MSALAPITARDPVTGQQPNGDLSEWTQRKDDAEQDQKRWHPIWDLCNSYSAGKQWVGWDRNTRRVIAEPNPDDRVRLTINVLTQYQETFVGKITQDDLQSDITFRKGDVESQAFAKQARGAVEYGWDEEWDGDKVTMDAIRKMAIYGTSVIHAYPDPGYGKVLTRLPIGYDGKAITDPAQAEAHVTQALQQGQQVSYQQIREGRICLDAFAPRGVLTPPGVEHERDFPWLIFQKPVSLGTIKLRYGAKAAKLLEESLRPIAFSGFSNDTGVDGPNGPPQPGKLRQHAMLFTGYEAPTGDYPLGRTMIWCQQTILAQSDSLPVTANGMGMIPAVFLRYHPVDGSCWAQGLIEPGIGAQRQRNRARSQQVEFKDRAALGRVYAHKGVITSVNKPKGAIFEVVEIQPGHEFPKETAGTDVSQSVMLEVEQNDRDLAQVMGTGVGGLAQPPPGISAFAALALLAEQDDKRVGPILKGVRLEMATLTKLLLHMMRVYWPPQKEIAVAGESPEGLLDSYVFNAAKLPETVYVKAGKGAPLPQSQAAEAQKIIDVFDRSISSGQPLPLEWLTGSLAAGQMLPIPESRVHQETDKADLENNQLVMGVLVQTAPYDNDELHVQRHRAAEMAVTMAAQVSPEPQLQVALQTLEQHIAMHLQSAQQKAAQADPGQSNGGSMPRPSAGTGGQNAGFGPVAMGAGPGALQAGPSA